LAIKRCKNGVIAEDAQFFERAPLWVIPVTIMGCCIIFFIGFVKELFWKMAQSLNLLPPVETNRQVSDRRIINNNNITISLDICEYIKFRDMHRYIQTKMHSMLETVTGLVVIVVTDPYAPLLELKSWSKNDLLQIMD